MIAYMPEIYEDELMYSWFCRYYAHSGYPGYVTALEDLLVNRYSRVDMEFCGKLNEEASKVISSMYDMEQLILEHTMYPQYARFASKEKQSEGMDTLITGQGEIHNVLVFPTSKSGKRYMRFCPECAQKDRETYGETFWHRQHQMRHIQVCSEHGCRLNDTEIEMAAKNSPRLWVAEEVVPKCGELNTAEESASKTDDDIEIQLARYAATLLLAPIPMEQPPIHLWLISKLEGSDYISARGQRKYISKLFQDMTSYFQTISDTSIAEQHQLQKLFTGYNQEFYAIIQTAYFLEIPVEELMTPSVPIRSQTERFDEQAVQLREAGLGNHRMAKKLGCSPSTAIKCLRTTGESSAHNYSVRLGMHRQNWAALDEESLSEVRTVCEQIYSGDGGRPKRVTEFAVIKAMGWPDKRLQYLPKCRSIVHDYSDICIEDYWAREVVWAYNFLQLNDGHDVIHWRQLRDITNLRKNNFECCKPYLTRYTDELKASLISKLI